MTLLLALLAGLVVGSILGALVLFLYLGSIGHRN
jgi:hypothetical protein